MAVVALYGSPRGSGFSAKALDLFLGPLISGGVTVIRVRAYEAGVKPCIACGECAENTRCMYDDMDRIYGDIRSASGIVISSPVYFSSLPGPLKNIIDRCQVFWEEKRRGDGVMQKKKGYVICTSGSEYKNAFNPSLIIIKHFFTTINCDYNESDSFLISGVDNINELSEDQKKGIRSAGERYCADLMPGAACR